MNVSETHKGMQRRGVAYLNGEDRFFNGIHVVRVAAWLIRSLQRNKLGFGVSYGLLISTLTIRV